MTTVPQVIKEFLQTLDRLEIPYMIGGSFASSAWGMPRQTNDLDIEVILHGEDAQRLFEQIGTDFLGSIGNYIEALQVEEEFPGFQLLHTEELFKIDVFLPSSGEYRTESFQRAVNHEMFSGFYCPFKSPEDTVITKLRWFELGGGVSDRQWNDIVQVLEAQKGSLEIEYMQRWCAHFGVATLLKEAMSQVQSEQ